MGRGAEQELILSTKQRWKILDLYTHSHTHIWLPHQVKTTYSRKWGQYIKNNLRYMQRNCAFHGVLEDSSFEINPFKWYQLTNAFCSVDEWLAVNSFLTHVNETYSVWVSRKPVSVWVFFTRNGTFWYHLQPKLKGYLQWELMSSRYPKILSFPTLHQPPSRKLVKNARVCGKEGGIFSSIKARATQMRLFFD